MTEKIIRGRLVQKHDSAENWAKATTFIPKQGELIIYDVDSEYSYERLKIGDGTTNVNDLPFARSAVTEEYVDEQIDNINEFLNSKKIKTYLINIDGTDVETFENAEITFIQGIYDFKDGLHSYPNPDRGGTTDFIEVKPDQVIRYLAYTTLEGALGCIYDENKTYIGNLAPGENQMVEVEMLMPTNARFIRLNYSGTDTSAYYVKVGFSNKTELPALRLKSGNITEEFKTALFNDETQKKYGNSVQKPVVLGTTAVAFGDSITAGVCSDNGTLTTASNSSYIKLFCDKQGLLLYNRGWSGSFICDPNNTNSICNKLLAFDYAAFKINTVFVAGGCNDYNFGKPLGVFGDTDQTTFYGALKVMCEHLKTNAPNATVIFITPINQSRSATGNAIFPNNNPYRNAIFEVATSFGFNVVDGEQMGFPTDFESPYKDYMIYDGVHPTTEGHKMYAKNLGDVLSNGDTTSDNDGNTTVSWNDLTDKPFYEGEGWVVSGNDYILSNPNEINGNQVKFTSNISNVDINKGTTYRVKITCPEYSTEEIITPTYDGYIESANSAEFSIDHLGTVINVSLPVAVTNCTLRISEGYEGIVAYPIDEKFIPDTIARVSDIENLGEVSWNDLQDKPFYEKEGYVNSGTVYSMTTPTSISGSQVKFERPADLYLAVGTSYRIKIITPGYTIEEVVAPTMGNYIETASFSIDVMTDGVYLFLGSSVTSCSLSIAAVVPGIEVKTLDDKYIPDTVVRMSDVATLVARIEALEAQLADVESQLSTI